MLRNLRIRDERRKRRIWRGLGGRVDKMALNNRKTELDEAIPVLWNQYEHMYNVRKNGTQNQINFLLVVVSFLPIISIEFYLRSNYIPYLMPVLLLFIALIILLKSFFTPPLQIPWSERNYFRKIMEQRRTNEYFFAQLKATERETEIILDEGKKIIKAALCLIIFSLYSLLLAFLFNNLQATTWLYTFTILSGLIFLFLFIFFYKSKHSDYDKNFQEIFKEISQWTDHESN